MGRVDASRGLDQPGFTHLLKLMEDQRFWVKVSGLERASRQGAPYADAVPFARKLVADFGSRVLWGSDWPHPVSAAHNPKAVQPFDDIDDVAALERLRERIPDQKVLRKILVDNPVRLYEF